MVDKDRKYRVVYCTPALYMAGGVERVLTLKANYFAENFGYDITIILTEGKDKPLFYQLSNKVKVVNLDINFEELWTCSFVKKVFVYLRKQRRFRKLLTEQLVSLRPDITVSLLRREINFLNDIQDGSKKVGELHVNRANYRNFEDNDSNLVKRMFSKYWMYSLVKQVGRLDQFVVLTEEDKRNWPELDNVLVIPDSLSFLPKFVSPMTQKRIIAVGRYVYQKGFDLLLRAWAMAEKRCEDWELVIFGQGDRNPYEVLINELGIDRNRCHLYGRTNNIEQEYCNSSIFVMSSRFEGFGMVLVEAMACGLPVISFDCPCGPKDIINHKDIGVLVENGNIGKLSDAMISMTKDEAYRSMAATKARASAQRYRMEVIAEQWRILFNSLAN